MSKLGTSDDEDTRRQQLREAGELLYGGNGARLAASLGCSVDLISKMLTGKRSVTREMSGRVGELLLEQSIELERRAVEARALAQKTLRPLTFLSIDERLSGRREQRDVRAEQAADEFERARWGDRYNE